MRQEEMTLIELLVVIALIGILAAILPPTPAMAREKENRMENGHPASLATPSTSKPLTGECLSPQCAVAELGSWGSEM